MDEHVESNLLRQDQDDPNYKEEIEGALKEDQQRIGDVFREKSEHGDNPDAIRKALGIPTVGSVYQNLGSVKTLLECKRLTSAPMLALQRARLLRSFAKRHGSRLSDETVRRLQELASEHQKVAEDEDALADEANRAKKQVEDQSGKPGIYVYTLPHYMKHPVIEAESDESRDRTYLKVGMSGVSTKKRIQQQTTTALPEPPLTLRRYAHPKAKDADYRELEEKMHRHLNAADHNQNRQTGAGKEWFLTHLPFIDSTAELLGMVIEYDYENEDH